MLVKGAPDLRSQYTAPRNQSAAMCWDHELKTVTTAAVTIGTPFMVLCTHSSHHKFYLFCAQFYITSANLSPLMIWWNNSRRDLGWQYDIIRNISVPAWTPLIGDSLHSRNVLNTHPLTTYLHIRAVKLILFLHFSYHTIFIHQTQISSMA